MALHYYQHNKLTPWSRIFPEKSRNSLHFIEPKGSLPVPILGQTNHLYNNPKEIQPLKVFQILSNLIIYPGIFLSTDAQLGLSLLH